MTLHCCLVLLSLCNSALGWVSVHHQHTKLPSCRYRSWREYVGVGGEMEAGGNTANIQLAERPLCEPISQ